MEPDEDIHDKYVHLMPLCCCVHIVCSDTVCNDEEQQRGRTLWSEKYSPKTFTDLLSDDVSLNMYMYCD